MSANDMTGAISVGRIGTITVRVHITLLPMLMWAAWWGYVQYGTPDGALFGFSAILLLFICVLIHELAHGIQALAHGILVSEILLLPIGGLTNIDAVRLDPRDEVRIALAGPFANCALALLFGLAAWLLWYTRTDPHLLGLPTVVSLVTYLAVANGILAVFNSLPFFPLDGGRALRAWLSQRVPYEQATHQAAQVGRIFGIAASGIGLFFAFVGAMPVGSMVVMCASGVFIAATYEDRIVIRNARLNNWHVHQILRQSMHSVTPQQPLRAALIGLAGGYFVPVLTDGRLVGLILTGDLKRGLDSSLNIAHVMRTRFPTVRAGDPLWIAYEKMRRARLNAIPVVNRDQFCGLVTLLDIQRIIRVGAPMTVTNASPCLDEESLGAEN
jgi:Zn-dependent protease